MTAQEIRDVVAYRLSILHDRLIGQSPEDLPGHYRLIGEQDALRSLLKYIDERLQD